MRDRGTIGERILILLSILMRVISWMGGLLTIVIGAGYAMFCVQWLHAPVGQVLMLTAALMALPLGSFILLGRLAAGMRRFVTDYIDDETEVTGTPPA